MKTIKDIVAMSAFERKAAFGVSGTYTVDGVQVERDIRTVTIDGIPFTDYGAFSFLWEKSYVKSPVRSGDGSIGNPNSYATFLTPHFKINFSLMSIESYRALMNLIYDKNEFTVTCYDVVHNKMTTNRMYFTTEEMPKLWTIARAINGEEWVELLGVEDYSVEMVGTNTSVDTINILYYDENGNLLDSQEATRGEYVVIQYNYTTSASNKRFDGEWLRDGNENSIIRNGVAIKANTFSDDIGEIKLYAKVVDTNEYTLSISYGNGYPLYNRQNGEVVNTVPIRYNQLIADAFEATDITLDNGEKLKFPKYGTGPMSVVVDDVAYTPYTFKGWYWTTTPSDISRVYSGTPLKQKANAVIYQVYEPIEYQVEYNTNTNAIKFDNAPVKYGSTVQLPTPRIEGYTFGGWFLDQAFTKSFGGTMPPYSITLYAKWVKNS